MFAPISSYPLVVDLSIRLSLCLSISVRESIIKMCLHCSVSGPICLAFNAALSNRPNLAIGQCWVQWSDRKQLQTNVIRRIVWSPIGAVEMHLSGYAYISSALCLMTAALNYTYSLHMLINPDKRTNYALCRISNKVEWNMAWAHFLSCVDRINLVSICGVLHH